MRSALISKILYKNNNYMIIIGHEVPYYTREGRTSHWGGGDVQWRLIVAGEWVSEGGS